ncbi:hypothetical protein ABTN42_22700, partial [Acinetobacter baumannii]
ILKDFDIHFTQKGLYTGKESLKDFVLQINQYEPSENFATQYLSEAKAFVEYAKQFREILVATEK